MYTFLQLQQKVKRLARLSSNDAETIAAVIDALNKAQYDLVRQRPELVPDLKQYRINLPLTTAVADKGFVILPADFMEVDQLTYTSGTTTWNLCERTKRVPPAKVYGKPKAYILVKGSGPTIPYGVLIEPYLSVIAGDSLLLDYYKAPTLMSADADTLASNIVEEEVLKRAIQYAAGIYGGKLNVIPALESLGQGNETPDDRTTPTELRS